MADNSEPERKNGPGRPFEKGASPNPGGRPKVIREALEEFRNADDLKRLRLRLLEIAEGSNEKVAVVAIKEYHDRAFGRAPQAITGPDGEALSLGADFAVLTVEQLRQLELIRDALKAKS